MNICNCFQKSEKEIIEAIQSGCNTLEKLSDKLLVTQGCGRCEEEIIELLKKI